MKMLKQCLIILTVCLLGELLEYWIPLPVAASVYGLLLMLAALLTGIVKLEDVEHVADFLVEIMPLMFIPPTVGIMACVEEMKQMLLPLVLISVVTTLLVMGVTGRCTQFLMRSKKKESKEAEKK